MRRWPATRYLQRWRAAGLARVDRAERTDRRDGGTADRRTGSRRGGIRVRMALPVAQPNIVYIVSSNPQGVDG
jgi:hypothetical protein